MTIDPSLAVSGAEWQIQPIEGVQATGEAAGESGSSFGSMLSDSISSLAKTQNDAASQAQALATGQADDPTAVVMSVERAQLSMQLAGQIRNKAVEAAQEIFRTQV
jgi:flagellar hook-basal body complex protein FliE